MDGGPRVPGSPEPGRPVAGAADAPLRLADILASLSLVADMGFGLPPEQAMRSCLVATALARALRLHEAEVAEVFYTALLEHIGCSGFAHEAAARYGDELGVNAAAARTNATDPRDVLGTFMPVVVRGRGPLGGARAMLMEVAQGGRVSRLYATSACEVGRATARRLGLPEGVQRGLHEVYEQWNGKGGAHGLRGDAIAMAGRVTQVGATAALFARIGGVYGARAAVRRRAGGTLDPEVVRAFLASTPAIIAAAEVDDPHAAVIDAEPSPALTVTASGLPEVAAAFADIPDLKSPQLHGHSSGVATLAVEAAGRLGLEHSAVERLRVAALLHDLGRVGISDAVWDRPGPLSGSQWEQVRLHAYHSERVLSRSHALSAYADIAGRHHERLDGSGYHRGSKARELPVEPRVLAVADAYQAMTHVRAHRIALRPDAAAVQLHAEVRQGRLDADATAAVLEAAGQGRGRIRRPAPLGLTEQEVVVLRAVAHGLSNREIATRLSISPRTAEHHVQHIYDKLGFSSRAAAALFAMEHDLLD